jgi:hypothetical protein
VLRRAGERLAPGGELAVFEIHPELRATGTQAHFRAADDGIEIPLPSHGHTRAAWDAAIAAAGLELTRAVDWCATPESLTQCAKLAKHLGRPVVIELRARPSGEGPTLV